MYRFDSSFNLCGFLGLCIYERCGLLEMYLGEGCTFDSGTWIDESESDSGSGDLDR